MMQRGGRRGNRRIGGGAIPAGIDRLAGVLGVASVWGVNPANLERCTDGDWEVMTGVGSKNIAAWTQAGQIDWDMGAVYSVDIRSKLRMGNNDAGGSTVTLVCTASIDNITWVRVKNWDTVQELIVNNVEDIFHCWFARARYIRLSWQSTTAACTIYGAVWEIEAIDFGV